MEQHPRARILLMPSSIGFAHLGRLLLVAEALRERDCAVAFAYGGPHGRQITQRGYAYFPISDIAAQDPTSATRSILEQYTESKVELCLRDDLAVMSHYRPDAVVTDFRPTAAISCHLASIPHAAVLNGSATDYFDMARLLVESDDSPLKYRLTSSFMHRLVAFQGRRLAAGLHAVARRNGVANRRTLFDFFGGDLNLLADLPGFVPLRDVPDNYRTIGPLIWEGAGEGPPLLPPLAEGQRRVYITIGNTGSRLLLDTALIAFADRPQFQVIATTGAYMDPAAYQGHANFHPFAFVPGSNVMQSSDLVIHGGGNGTTYQCLKNGLPAVVVPSNNEQIVAARLLRYHKVGVPLALRDLSPERLRDLSIRLMNDQVFRARAAAFSAQFASMDGGQRAADEILRYVAKGRDRSVVQVAASLAHRELGKMSARP